MKYSIILLIRYFLYYNPCQDTELENKKIVVLEKEAYNVVICVRISGCRGKRKVKIILIYELTNNYILRIFTV